jgi:1,4-alpha-glucan branching enzyme
MEKKGSGQDVVHGVSLAGETDIYLFREGSHARLYNFLGAHVIEHDGIDGVLFAVWAPNAEEVSVIGDFNSWDPDVHKLAARWDSSGIWEGFIPGIPACSRYKYSILTKKGERLDKGDPFAFLWEEPPLTASKVYRSDTYKWNDKEWMSSRKGRSSTRAPQSIYEIHAGSWRRTGTDTHSTWLTLAEELPLYLTDNGFTHVEFLPVMEHPFYGSWGYQTTGYFAPTSRYGSPEDFMFLIDRLHQAGIAVILDWVPSHFPSDSFGLQKFDGTCLYEHSDPRRGFHPDWKSCIFNYGRSEVRSFLISSARFWLDRYHADGLRVDAVASMLYLDYSRKDGEWLPNIYGGRENIEAIDFLKKLNETLYLDFPDIQMTAEDSTAWPMVSRPTWLGGLGFGYKWNMGWMNDILKYMGRDPVFRQYHHNSLTFGMWYAYSENFVLPLSHDEVVYGKGSLWGRMPGDDWQKAANLRLLFGWMFGHPGKKLLFMGGEFGQEREWNHEASLDWHILKDELHSGMIQWFHDINSFYKETPQLWELDYDSSGFEWIDCSDVASSVVSFLRRASDGREVIFIGNFTPIARTGYRIGVPGHKVWREALNSDSSCYGGSNTGNLGKITAEKVTFHGRPYSIKITLPPLACLVLVPEDRKSCTADSEPEM